MPERLTWEQLAGMSPEEIRDHGLFPTGFLPLPHANHLEGGMVFPPVQIDEVRKQTSRDLSRFDLDFDLPDHFTPEFPPPILGAGGKSSSSWNSTWCSAKLSAPEKPDLVAFMLAL